MALLGTFASSLKTLCWSSATKILPKLYDACANPAYPMVVRAVHTDWRMIKDLKRRTLVRQHATERLRINCIRKNTVLPKAIQDIADIEIERDFPRDSFRHRVVNRCAVTSRPRSVLRRWRLSRIMFRHLADYNYLSGVQRAMW